MRRFFILRDPNPAGDQGSGGTPPQPTITFDTLNGIEGDAFRALVPEDVRGKGYMKDVNTFGDLVKKLDGAQTLLGQRAVPDATSTPEQWAAFHSKMRPETAEGYKIPKQIEGVPPEFIKKASESKVMRDLVHAAGLSPYQANILLPQFLKTIYTAEQNESKAKDEAFVKLTTDLFGDKKEEILNNGKAYLATNLPDNMKGLLNELDEKQMSVVLALTNSLVKKGSEDPFQGGGSPAAGGSAQTEAQVIAAMQEVMRDPAYMDPFKDKVKNQQLVQKMEGLRAQLRKIKNIT